MACKITRVTDLHCSMFLLFSFFSLFLSGMALSRPRSVVCRAHIQAFTLSWLTLKMTIGCPSSTYPSFVVIKKLVHTCRTPGSVLQKIIVSYGHVHRADACTSTSKPQHSFPCRRFQTGETPEKLAYMFRLLGPCLETRLRRWRTR